MGKKIIIVGGVASGTKAGAKAKREDPSSEVIIFTNEEYISYSGCGLPYYIGGVVSAKEHLILKTPQDFKHDMGIDVYTKHEVVYIDPENKKIIVKDLSNNTLKEFYYDKLILATGASPVKPKIEGFDLKKVFTLRSVNDALKIREILDNNPPKNPLIVGGGFIGLEIAENLKERGLNVKIIEVAEQILPGYDFEIAKLVEKYLIEEKGINILTKKRVTKFLGNEKKEVSKVILENGEILDADLVIWSAGVKPNTDLAKKIGIELGDWGAIKVDKYMRTNIKDIFAVGDCVETYHLVCGKPVWIPMGSTANKMGRVAGINVVLDDENLYESFEGVLGTNILKLFNLTIAKTGLSEKQAREEGFDVVSAIVPSNDKAHYYPTSKSVILKLIGDRKTGRILGAQGIGEGSVDKFIDIIASFIYLKGTVDQLSKVDLAYSPPYSMALSSVIVTANVLKNKIQGKLKGINPWELYEKIKNKENNFLLIDVRTEPEFVIGAIPGSINIPLNELMEKAYTLDREREIILICGLGRRAYQAYTKLVSLGFKNIKILDGGIKAYPFELE
ncbi:MAG: FAD-dependent oxidoreductase [Dictyoglomus sp.]|nr:FAD-dependent oxidoreductase [Dictyoglomus sp.]MDW8188282.1 FAD-dependent oxidoreductase [Dictyoglomus sp.]